MYFITLKLKPFLIKQKGGKCCKITLLYAVNIFYSHWLINYLTWPIVRQDRAR